MQLLALPFHPQRLSDPREPLIGDLLRLSNASKQDCVDKIIEMLEDFHNHGFDKAERGANLCRFLKPFGGAVYELKGGKVGSGGPRVYLIRADDGFAYLTHAECKKENAASQWMIADTLEIQDALEAGTPIFPEPQRTGHGLRLERLQPAPRKAKR